ncbi:MAG: flagellar hook-associated protein FlgK [Rhodoferax sp.]|nr:flagellar hook-associated protein FlgK [Rhodoferax sp.]
MGGILSVGVAALQANQVALTTAGNNIANVNTQGYSRQKVVLQTVPGQYTGGGFIGKGVAVQTIQRNFDEFLNRQSTIAGAMQASDTTRADYLRQLATIFQGGANGLGASINDMLNSFSDVASAPTDLTARTVALTRVDETARRMRTASQNLDDLRNGIRQTLTEKVAAINTLAQNIAEVNEQIARVNGTGQPPNDLLDHRDELIRKLNQYVQTTTIKADDGTLGVFIGGSQSLVLGSDVATVSIGSDEFNDPQKAKLYIQRSGMANPIQIDENMLGGGEIPGLLRFQNFDLAEGRNLLGRLTLAVTTSMNDQHKLGLDLDGNVGGDLFTPTNLSAAANILIPQAPARLNVGDDTLAMTVNDVTKFVASDYEVNFSSPTTFTVTRKSDGVMYPLPVPPGSPQLSYDTTLTNPVTVDGIDITWTAGATPLAAGDRFLLKPFSTSASTIDREFASPRALAVSSPVAATLSTTNTGTLALNGIVAKTLATTAAAPIDNFRIVFNVVTGFPTTYDIIDTTTATTMVAGATFVSGQPIDYPTPSVPGTPGFKITLTGLPANGDNVDIRQNPYANLNSGNATAMMDLRDIAMFDGAALTDGYAGLISQIGIRTQSANYAAEVSTNIAVNAEKDRSGVSGVNLDEEAAKLLQFQQAYQASAKMIQIAQSIFDTLIQGLSR